MEGLFEGQTVGFAFPFGDLLQRCRPTLNVFFEFIHQVCLQQIEVLGAEGSLQDVREALKHLILLFEDIVQADDLFFLLDA